MRRGCASPCYGKKPPLFLRPHRGLPVYGHKIRLDFVAIDRPNGRRKADAQTIDCDVVLCQRCSQSRLRFPERPFKGELGERILASTCRPYWAEWILMGSKVVDELRLVLANPADAETYDQHMKEFLNIE